MDTVHVYRDHVGDKCLKGLALATSPDYTIRFSEEESS